MFNKPFPLLSGIADPSEKEAGPAARTLFLFHDETRDFHFYTDHVYG